MEVQIFLIYIRFIFKIYFVRKPELQRKKKGRKMEEGKKLGRFHAGSLRRSDDQLTARSFCISYVDQGPKHEGAPPSLST